MNTEITIVVSLSIFSIFISMGILIYILSQRYSKTITNNRFFEKVSKREFLKSLSDETLYREIRLPTRATKNSAGYDIYSPFEIVLEPGEEIKFPTGFKVSMNEDNFFMILPRSGLGFKYFVRLANTVGVIDADYFDNDTNEGHVFAKLRNEGKERMVIKKGEAFAQGIFLPYLITKNDFTKGSRTGGFGSTSK